LDVVDLCQFTERFVHEIRHVVDHEVDKSNEFIDVPIVFEVQAKEQGLKKVDCSLRLEFQSFSVSRVVPNGFQNERNIPPGICHNCMKLGYA
jgi:hypothetical protein